MRILNHSSIYPQLIQDYTEILQYLKDAQYEVGPIVESQKADNVSGEAYSLAYPIQGLLKYHGMFDPMERIAYFPSISLNNNAISSITYLKFDPHLQQDKFILNGIDVMYCSVLN